MCTASTYYSDGVVQRKAADGEDLAYRDDNVSQQEQLDFSPADSCSLPLRKKEQAGGDDDCETTEQDRAYNTMILVP